MAHIKLTNASVEFPVFDGNSRSFKNRMLEVATGGIISQGSGGVVKVRGLEQVNLEITQGERVGILGHNGAGKTTLLRLLSNIYFPTSGDCLVEGSCYSLINPMLGIDPEASGHENIRLRAAIMGISKSDLDRVYNEIVEFTDLGDFLDLPFRTYSTGMQTRLAFAVSTVIRPDILIMDEWLSTGDEAFRGKASKRLTELVTSSKILVLASHSYDLLAVNCTRFVWLEHGRIKKDGDRTSVLDEYFNRAPAADAPPEGMTE